MIHKTKGIVLRAIKYGETSLVVTIFTEVFGVQTYMVNGVRSNKKTGSKAALYQPAAILEMEVYHNDQKAMHRIRECNWAFLYQDILSDVVKNSIALYMVELLYKTLKQPEQNSDLFYFSEDALQQLDAASNVVAANFSLYYTLHLPHFFGFRISDMPARYRLDGASSIDNIENIYLDLQEGIFTPARPTHPYFLEGEDALITAELLRIMQPSELDQLKMNHLKRRALLEKYLEYYGLHIPDFGAMKTLMVMQEVLG
jgi:DNA repair protein RecO (recombination protein O)